MATKNGNGIPRHPAVWWSRAKTKWPILVWLAAVALFVVLYRKDAAPLDLVGVVEVPVEHAALVETARLADVPVAVGQVVEPGEVLARFALPVMESELAVERLRVERQFVELVQSAETALREARLDLARDRAELSALTAELERLQSLRERGLADDQDLARVRAPRQALLTAVELYPDFIAHLEQQLEEARALRAAVAAEANSDAASQALQARQQAAYTVTAADRGTVSAVAFQPGDVVPGGESVVTLLRDAQPTVMAYVREGNTVSLDVGSVVYLRTWGSPHVLTPGRVVSVGPAFVELPVSLQRVPRQTLLGRPVVIRPDEPVDAAPGERVGISFEPDAADLIRRLLRR